jgi:transcriptional regulator with XRE-family HTH domain
VEKQVKLMKGFEQEDQEIRGQVSEMIRVLLKEQRRSLTDLAEYTGMSRPTIYRVLEHKSNLHLQDAIRIARFFSISLDELYGLNRVSGIPREAKLTPVFGMNQNGETPGLQKTYKRLARKELAKVLSEAAKLLEEE